MAGTFARLRETMMDKTAEQLAHALRAALPHVDRARAVSGGDADIAAMNARAALAAYDAEQLAARMDAAAAGTSKSLRDGTLAGTVQEHTAEPWSIGAFMAGGGRTAISVLGNAGERFTVEAEWSSPARLPIGRLDANARRIVACVNACAGMSTEQLEELANGQLADIGHNWLRDS